MKVDIGAFRITSVIFSIMFGLFCMYYAYGGLSYALIGINAIAAFSAFLLMIGE